MVFGGSDHGHAEETQPTDGGNRSVMSTCAANLNRESGPWLAARLAGRNLLVGRVLLVAALVVHRGGHDVFVGCGQGHDLCEITGGVRPLLHRIPRGREHDLTITLCARDTCINCDASTVTSPEKISGGRSVSL